MLKKHTNALIFSDMGTTTKGSKERANKMTFSTFRQKKNDAAPEPGKCVKTTNIKRIDTNSIK